MQELALHGRINEAGQLEIHLPEGLPAGEVDVVIRLSSSNASDDGENQPWTEAEIQEATTFGQGKTGAEIVAMLKSGELDTSTWLDMNIPDSVAWLKAQRRQQMNYELYT